MRRFFLIALLSLSAGSEAMAAPPVGERTNFGSAIGPTDSRLNQIEIKQETLPSGMRVILAKMPSVPGQTPRIYVATYILYGSMGEKHRGRAHLAEHVIANNKPLAPEPPLPPNVKAIAGNALTRPYFTSFVRIVPPELLANALHNRIAKAGQVGLDSAIFLTEKARVIAEIERDMRGAYPAYKSLQSLADGSTPRLRSEIEDMASVGENALYAEIAPHYRPSNAILVVAGDFDLVETWALIQATSNAFKWTGGHIRQPAAKSKVLKKGKAALIPDQNQTNKYIAGAAWPKPALVSPDRLPLLIVDQLLLGGWHDSDASIPENSLMGVELSKKLHVSNLWDGRAGTWGTPSLADTGPGISAILFSSNAALTPEQVSEIFVTSLQDIRAHSMSDAAIIKARDELANFYELWLFEPTYRIISDHLMAYAATGHNPCDVKNIADNIRAVRPQAVRAAFDRYYAAQPLVVVLPPSMQDKPANLE